MEVIVVPRACSLILKRLLPTLAFVASGAIAATGQSPSPPPPPPPLPALSPYAIAPALQYPAWVTDSWAVSVACSDRLAYVGGYFNLIAPYTGGGAVVDLERGDLVPPTPRVSGNIAAVAPDGAGGWFIGGDFDAIGGIPRSDLAHLRADGTLDPWNPGVRGPGAIYTLLVRGNTVYVAGAFNQIGAEWRANLAAIDAVTGAVLDWHPAVAGYVYALAARANTIYLGGLFPTVNFDARSNLAAVDATTGALLPWHPDPDREVNALLVSGRTVYVGGCPMTIGVKWKRNALAAVDAVSGEVLPWDPAPTTQPNSNTSVLALEAQGRRLFVAGVFNHIGGRFIELLAAVDMKTGLATEWTTGRITERIWRLALQGNTLYLGGDFVRVGDQPRYRLAAVDATTGALTDWAPTASSYVRALAVSGSTAYVGGTFKGVGGRVREGAAAIDMATGAITDWDPRLSAHGGVRSIIVHGDVVYLGGGFPLAGGEPRVGVAAVDALTGDLRPWNAHVAEGEIGALALTPDALFVGGLFFEVAGQPRNCLAAVDPATGALLPWDAHLTRQPPRLPPEVTDLAVGGSTMYTLANSVWTLGGSPVVNGIGAVDVTTALATGWYPHDVQWTTTCLAVDGQRVYAGKHYGVQAFDVASGDSLWLTPHKGSTRGFAVDAGTLYTTGWFDTIGGAPRVALAALDAATGAVLDWNPRTGPFGYGSSLAQGGGRIWIASPDGVIAVERADRSVVAHGGAARPAWSTAAPVATGLTLERAPALVRDEARLHFQLPAAARVTLSVFDVQGRRIDRPLDAVPLGVGAHEVTLRTGGWKTGVYLWRLDAGGHSIARRMVVIP